MDGLRECVDFRVHVVVVEFLFSVIRNDVTLSRAAPAGDDSESAVAEDDKIFPFCEFVEVKRCYCRLRRRLDEMPMFMAKSLAGRVSDMDEEENIASWDICDFLL